MISNTRVLQLGQQALPLVLCTLGVLELGAAIFGPALRLDTAGLLAAVGPGALVPVTLAVVFATLLRASASTLGVKAVTAVGAGFFALARVSLVVVLAVSGAPIAVGGLLAMVSGTVLGISLAAWAAIEYRAAQLYVAELAARRERSVATQASPAYSPSPASEAPPPPVLPSSPPSGAAPDSESTPITVIRPVAPRPDRQAPGAVSGSGALWHRGSTPWPRKNEDDPDSTLLRPPRRR